MSSLFVDANIADARTLSTIFYLDPLLFDEAKERIFFHVPHFIEDQIVVAHPNDCYPFTLLPSCLDIPLLLTKDSGDDIHCVSNVCTHRGNLIVQERCNQSRLRCCYHGRIFDMDGKFKLMPEFKEVNDFPSVSDDLNALPVYRLGNWLFTSLNSAVDPALFLGDMQSRLAWLPLSEFRFRPEWTHEFTVKAHWALYCENYLEGFHIPFVHAGLNAVIDFGAYETVLHPYSSLQIGIAKQGEQCFDLPSSSPDYGKHVAAYYYFIFPNLMFNFYPWGLSLNIVEPVSINETRVRYQTYVWKEALMNQGAGSDLNTVEMEDEAIVEAVQQGIRSPFYKHGRYSVTREQGTHHFHRLICSFMNGER